MLKTCASAGCETKVFGSGFCVVCEPTPPRLFLRGRPLQSLVGARLGVREKAAPLAAAR